MTDEEFYTVRENIHNNIREEANTNLQKEEEKFCDFEDDISQEFLFQEEQKFHKSCESKPFFSDE